MPMDCLLFIQCEVLDITNVVLSIEYQCVFPNIKAFAIKNNFIG